MPKPDSVAHKSDNSRHVDKLLSTYLQFLASYPDLYNSRATYAIPSDHRHSTMAAIFDHSDPASPLAYKASQTALLLMDFQGLIIKGCGASAQAALANAVLMRDWAQKNRVMVIHSVVDVQGKPPATCKGAARINKMLTGFADNKAMTEEPTEVAFSQAEGEYIVLKHPGSVSALKSKGAMELLKEHKIESLILCGLSTSGALLRTAMPATDEGFVVSVIEDACADPVEGLHETLIKSVLPSRAHVATAEEFMQQWKQSGER